MEVNNSLDISHDQRTTILSLLDRHLPGTEAWVYGSRANWTARSHSDLDLVVFATNSQSSRVGALREAFEESNLPFRVDLFVWNDIPDSFRSNILVKHVVLVENSNDWDIWHRAIAWHYFIGVEEFTIANLQDGLSKPKYVTPVPKVHESIGRIKEKYSKAASHYEA